jgi:phage anti-repressor protein
MELYEEDALFQLMKSKMTSEQEQMFMHSHYLYLEHGADSTAFVVDFDNVWKEVEFSRLDSAKRVLVRKFKEHVDYIIAHGKGAPPTEGATLRHETSVEKVHGGQNKETILLTVDCFKQFCFLADTPKAREIRSYYIKMESIVQEYYKNLKDRNNELQNSLQVSQHETAIERHKILIDTHQNKWLVYFCKVQSFDDGSFILKVGETMNLKNRMEALKCDFEMDIMLLDVFVSENSIALEKALHNSSQLVRYRYHQLQRKNKKFSTEAYHIPNQRKYEKIVNFAKEEMNKYNTLYTTKLNFLSSLLPLCKNIDEFQSTIEKIAASSLVSHFELPRQTIVDSEPPDEELENTHVETHIGANATGPIVQIYHKDDCQTVVQVYLSIMEATREFNYNNKTASFTAIKKAHQHKTVYLDYRWHFIFDRKERDLDKPRNIGETVITHERNQGQVAMLNLGKTKILKVFKLAKDAAKEILQHPSAMCSAIKHSSPLNNHYWIRWQNVDESLQQAYLRANILPQKEANVRGIKIKLLHPTTNELIKVFASYTEIQKELKVSVRKIKECIETNTIYRGIYKFVRC